MPKRSRPVRTRIRFRVEIRGSRQSFAADARDLSVEGFCFSSPIRLTVGDRAGASLFDVSLSFEVRWVRPDGPTRTLVGAEFLHTPETRKRLRALMWQIDSGTVVEAVEPT